MTQEDTLVLDKDYVSRAQDDATRPAQNATGEIDVDGVRFRWWAADDHRTRVTVKNALLGSAAKITKGNVEAVATSLARRLLDASREASARPDSSPRAEEPRPDPMKKPGWFQT